jgi:formimidoylglutamate deiminase
VSGRPDAAPAQVVAAELTWTGESFEPDVRVEVGADGRIAAVDFERAGDGEPAGPAPTLRLPGRALLPGFVNAHSHAFQRGLRGLAETFPRPAGGRAGGAGGTFWSWREAMYALAGRLDRERFHELSLAAFREMRSAGITAVGEFHYLHHDDPEAADWAFDRVVLDAAREAGIRLVLLQACYRAGGFGRPLESGQRRFRAPSLAAYWEQVDRLAGLLDPATQSLGAVAHSLRAVALVEIAALHAEARRRGLPFHLHVEEQRREVDDCVALHGARPMALLLAELAIGPETTAVHCTHTDPGDLERFVAAGGAVCACPLTEANLGDGIPPRAAVPAAAGRLCLGTDSNARVSMLEEMRWLEYGQRLAGERRGVLAGGDGRVAPVVLAAATAGGARALGLPAGAIAPGLWADFAAIDLGHPALEGAAADDLAAALVFGAGDGAVAATCVGGQWREHRA